MKIAHYIFKFFSWIIVAAIVMFCAIAAPLIAGYHPVVVLSGSMEPAYPVGSITYYKNCSYEQLKIGDVITFGIGDGALVTHRIVGSGDKEMSFKTKGDANESADPKAVSYAAVKGKTTAVRLPFVGFFVQYFQKPIVLGAAGMILILDYLIVIYMKKRQEKND